MRQWGVNNLPKVVAQHRARTHDPWIASPTPYRLACTAPPRWICTMSLAERPVDILLPAVVSSFHCILFSPRSCHHLSTAERRLSMHAVLLPGKHFPSISLSIVARTTLSLLLFQWQYLESFRCLIALRSLVLLVYQSSPESMNPFCPADSQHPTPYPHLKSCD